MLPQNFSCLKSSKNAVSVPMPSTILHEKENTRFNELKRRIPGITNFMLTKSLRELEADGLVIRREHVSAPLKVVEYSLAPLGKELIPALNELYAWGLKILQNDVRHDETDAAAANDAD